MRIRYALLAMILIQTLCASAVGARGSVITGRASLTETTLPCTLDVVLVTFRDAKAAPPMGRTDCGSASPKACDYHEHDRPYGTNPGQDVRDRYTLRDFERLFSGGYEPLQDLPFVGDTVHVANGHKLPEVFGSVRAYYDLMSNGAFQLRVRIINPADDQGYPRWVELPQTKAHYADIKAGDETDRRDDPSKTKGDWFWDDAYTAAQAAVDVWYPDTDEYDLPNDSYDTAQRLRRKVLYLYSGATYTARSPAGLLHPQADKTTEANPSKKSDVGYRYVMGEREGWGKNNHTIDEFAGIGIHAHEIGHLLGLNHGDGEWMPDPSTSSETHKGANFVGWGLMQGGREGPERPDTTSGLSQAYSSCPVPINPFYRMDLGWLKPTEITESKDDYALALGSVHLIDVGTHDLTSNVAQAERDTLLLERRSNHSFGRYISFHNYKNQDPGLLIWRRDGSERPILIVADGRRIRDAREGNSMVPEYWDQLSDPFPGSAAVNAAYAHTAATGLRQETSGSYSNQDPGNLGVALTDIQRGNGKLTLDIQLNYWAGAIAGRSEKISPAREVWGDGAPSWDTGTIYVAGDVSIPHGARLTIARGTKVHFLANTDDTGGGRDRTRSELIVEGELTVEEASDASDGGVTFRSANDTPSNADWYGIRVVGGGTATLSDATVRDGSRCVQEEEEEGKSLTLTMTNASLTNCGATVTLDSIPPYVDREITATLDNSDVSMTDPQRQWQWQRRRRSTDGWTDIPLATTRR